MENWESIWPQAIAKAWQDGMFRQALLDDAGAALKEHFSFDPPAGLHFKVVEGGETTATTLVLPQRPVDLDDGLVELMKPAQRLDVCCCC